jgi:leader peptidase (prepilin peptidase)/N-methyltransferase
LLEADIASLALALSGLEYDPRAASLIEAFLGAGVSSGLLWFVAWSFEKIRHKEGMGQGDIKMMALIGAFWGLRPALFTFFLASLVGSVVGILFIWLARKQASTYELPFGSFLGAVALAVAFLMR